MAETTANRGHTVTSDAIYLEHVLPSLVELFEPSSKNMCEFGDIMLVIEDGHHAQLKMQVNSCILASTSKVFKTLLRGCFAEGEAIRSGTREIYMNDKPAPMLALCQLLHLKPVEPAVDEADLIDFAMLVDKFDCVQGLRHATDGMLGHFDPDVYCESVRHDLVASAYILDQPAHFRRFTKSVVLHATGLYNPELDPQVQSLTIEHLPASFMASIAHQQSAVRTELVRCLTNIIDQFTTTTHDKHQPNLVYQLMATMKANELWPVRAVTHWSESLQDQLKSFCSLELPVIRADRNKKYSRRTSPDSIDNYNTGRDYDSLGEPVPWPPQISGARRQGKHDKTCQITTQRTVFDLSKRLEDLCVGLRLDCLKGKEACRVPHPYPWAAYHGSLEMWFEDERPRADPSPSIGWGEEW